MAQPMALVIDYSYQWFDGLSSLHHQCILQLFETRDNEFCTSCSANWQLRD